MYNQMMRQPKPQNYATQHPVFIWGEDGKVANLSFRVQLHSHYHGGNSKVVPSPATAYEDKDVLMLCR